MGLKASFDEETDTYTHTQYVGLDLYVETLDKHGNPADLSQFSNAVYQIVDSAGDVKISKTIGDGIRIEQHFYFIDVSGAEMSFSGDYTHHFVLFDKDNEALDPIFDTPFHVEPFLLN